MGLPGEGNAKKRQRVLIRPAEVVATGLAGAVAAFVTSRFGIAGTVLGTAVAVMIITAASSLIQAYLEGAAGRLLALPRRRVLLGAAASAALSLLVGLAAVTGVELGAGKTLSCWLWDRCPAGERPAEDRVAAARKTRPSVLGGEPAPPVVSRAAPQAAGLSGAPQRAPENRSAVYVPQTPAPQGAPAPAPRGSPAVRRTGQSAAPQPGGAPVAEPETPEVRPIVPETPDTERPEEVPMPEVPAPGEEPVIPAPGD
ncbi:hypothetical protein Rxyl_0671 [Rubrobacter xylanophilus DSM 9941]|uniref:Uncharacterized protein n=1 Tax=Rubrobacter xylanophilus (strain DSM 9941 / JCM 11954 / NBRC 16129 / PRD-1) TaxID=266117 RepID=Q1AY87_RUBXD|nr:hypothetical protein [Rubrobacter xylanophilus]ABG03641.1 hypothetical protein Rxyl_0671 [Rubrobacter xylanophilus DSM 9941]